MSSNENLSDIGTKRVPGDRLQELCRNIGLSFAEKRDKLLVMPISYVSPSCKSLNAEPSCSLQPSADLVEVGHENQWDETGRDDLSTICYLNVNTVRHHSHKEFLDRAQSVGLHVLPGFTEDMML